jgi:small subunit ribosomal protein S6
LNQYEAMFLFDPTFGSAFENCEAEIHRLLERAEAQVVFLRKWDERRLAYKIEGRKRGIYVLVYFKADAGKIAPLERDAQLAENILRLLVLRAEEVTPEMMERGADLRTATGDEDEGNASRNAYGPKKPAGQEDVKASEKPAEAEPLPVTAEASSFDAPTADPDDEPVAEIS